MATPKLLLISRRSLDHNLDAVQERLRGINIQLAVALAPEDADAAKKLTEAVAKFEYVTAIVADFEADMAVNDDGTTEMLGYTPVLTAEPKLITEAQ